MSINELIHTNAHHAFEQGKQAEQARIIEALEAEYARITRLSFADFRASGIIDVMQAYEKAIAIAKGNMGPEWADFPESKFKLSEPLFSMDSNKRRDVNADKSI